MAGIKTQIPVGCIDPDQRPAARLVNADHAFGKGLMIGLDVQAAFVP